MKTVRIGSGQAESR